MTDESLRPIRFYTARGPRGGLSNFSRHAIRLKDKVWPTSEHYFQAQKFVGHPVEEMVRLAGTPTEAKKLGSTRRYYMRKDWDNVREEIMLEVLYAKFSQHADLRAMLLETGNAPLVEHTAKDSYWGDGGDGSGKNRLGICLGIVRQRLRDENTETMRKRSADEASRLEDTPPAKRQKVD